jgi:DNA-binding phage protein
MPLTRSFKDTVHARAAKEPAFRRALLVEGVEALIAGDLDAGKIMLRDYINATLGFDELARVTDIAVKSLIRMFGAGGNPQARNLFAVVAALQKREKVALAVAPVRARC